MDICCNSYVWYMSVGNMSVGMWHDTLTLSRGASVEGLLSRDSCHSTKNMEAGLINDRHHTHDRRDWLHAIDEPGRRKIGRRIAPWFKYYEK